ncbi:MAG: TspO/MBR family protein [Candidatus Micrarchaeia archaeon]
MDLKEAGKLILAIILCNLAGAIGSIFTFSAIPTWYATLIKPEFNPPNWIFGPVWTALYVLMGISLYLIWKQYEKGKNAKTALTIFSVQWVLNALWSFLFFGLQSPLYGLLCIIPLWISIAVMIAKFYPLSKNAALLQIPYLLWVSFATVLNASIWVLN